MRRAWIAALLSAFIFPGIGLWYLGHFTRALIFAVPALFALSYLIYGLCVIAPSILLDKSYAYILQIFSSDETSFNAKALLLDIKYQADQIPELYQSQWILFCAWLLGIVASFMIGLQESSANASRH